MSKSKRQQGKFRTSAQLGSRAGSGGRTVQAQWEHLARRKQRENWPVRKIAKFLGKPVDEVKAALR